MSDAAWSALAALAGVALGGGISWLNGWDQSKRERRREWSSVRRAAYVELLYRAQVLLSAIASVGERLEDFARENDGIPFLSGSDVGRLRADLDTPLNEFKRAEQALTLSATPETYHMARPYIDAVNNHANAMHRALDAVTDREFDGWEERFEALRRQSSIPPRRDLLTSMQRDLQS